MKSKPSATQRAANQAQRRAGEARKAALAAAIDMGLLLTDTATGGVASLANLLRVAVTEGRNHRAAARAAREELARRPRAARVRDHAAATTLGIGAARAAAATVRRIRAF
ncbi:hypothetical protein [Streptomyces sp. CC224B]|uniref:hypothetical protein n=1 Tax=Streptomyces sp. CC224B TaxID=3044571 RepID=UPI0024A8D561|nr:hypothetical protein [Streptomyces sp. CC224B]